MAKKENKGGFLTNEELEKDLKAKGNQQNEGHYQGMQDTGDRKIRDNRENNEKSKDNDQNRRTS